MVAFLNAIGDTSAYQIGKTVPGITANDVSRWRRDKWDRLSSDKRATLQAFLEAERDGGTEASRPPIAPAADDHTRVRTDVGGLGPPGENTARKLDLLKAHKEYVTRAGRPLGDWWWAVRGEVEGGEL